MLTIVALLLVSLTLISSSGEGNIHLLEDEVAIALRACSDNGDAAPKRIDRNNRRGRSVHYEYQGLYGDHVPRSNDVTTQNYKANLYDKEKDSKDQMYALNGTDNDIINYGRTGSDVKFVSTAKIPFGNGNSYALRNRTRHKRSGPLINKSDKDQCHSQCVFANLQVVDENGFPRETELWNKIQSGVTSQQSRTVLKDQIRACFQELQSEAEDNGCSYSNKLERCLMLRFRDRRINGKKLSES